MIKAVIFDFDGVLAESVDIKTRAFAALFQDEGTEAVNRIVDYHLENSGVSRFEKIKYIFDTVLKRQLSEKDFGSLCERFAQLVVDEVVKAPYVKGAREFIEENYAILSFFVASATPHAEIAEIVRRRGMAQFFKGIFGAPCPKGEIVGNIISSNEFSVNEYVYIGDALSDYEAAKAHGMKFIARIRGNEALFAGYDCLKVTDLTGLKLCLDGMDSKQEGLNGTAGKM